MMNKIKYCWIKTLRKTVLALLQINVNFVLIARKFIPYFLETVTPAQKNFEQVHLKFKIYTEKFYF